MEVEPKVTFSSYGRCPFPHPLRISNESHAAHLDMPIFSSRCAMYCSSRTNGFLLWVDLCTIALVWLFCLQWTLSGKDDLLIEVIKIIDFINE